MRVAIKGVAPPPVSLFPSPAAAARGGERAVLRPYAWPGFVPAAICLCLPPASRCAARDLGGPTARRLASLCTLTLSPALKSAARFCPLPSIVQPRLAEF